MSQRNPQQQGLQTTRPAQGELTKAVPMSGKLTRLPERGSISTSDPNQATRWIEDAFEFGIPVVPFGNSVPLMGPGYGVMVTPVYITDFDKFGTQVYPIQGSPKMGIHKGPMDDIATGCGFDWPVPWTFVEPFPEGDERNRDPRCIKITVAGRYKDVDGSWKTLPPQTKEIDLREGSAEVHQIRTRHLDKQLSDLPPNATEAAIAQRTALANKKADAELDQNRKFIRSYAQTKARLMVIGTRMRRAYSVEELKKGPFYCFKIIQTWRSENPATQARFDQAIIDRELGASNMLYGTPVGAAPRELPPVSNEPYPDQPEQVDAGVVAEATAEPEVVQEPEATTCSPGRCIGLRSLTHLEGCFPQQEKSATPQTTKDDNTWVIPGKGPARGLKITDPKVTPDTLLSLLKEYGDALNPQGDLYDKLADEGKDFYSSALREVQKELDRRQIKFDGEPKY
jgi:hypothetical protein